MINEMKNENLMNKYLNESKDKYSISDIMSMGVLIRNAGMKSTKNKSLLDISKILGEIFGGMSQGDNMFVKKKLDDLSKIIMNITKTITTVTNNVE